MNIIKKNKKSFVIVSMVAILIIAGIFALVYASSQKDPTLKHNPEYPETVAMDSSTSKQQTINAKDADHSLNLSDKTTEEIPASKSGVVRIINLSQKDGFINILAETSDFNTQTCVYMFTSENARPVIREMKGSCMGFSIPEVEFEKVGTYKLTVSAYSNGTKISSSSEIVVQ